MISGKQYSQLEELKKNRREAFKRAGILTDEEFYSLTSSERLEYVKKQNELHMPVTVERDTPYDANFQVKKSGKEKKVDVNAKIRHAQTKGIIMNALGLSALIDIIHNWWGHLQNSFIF